MSIGGLGLWLDTARSEALIALAKGADVLVHEVLVGKDLMEI